MGWARQTNAFNTELPNTYVDEMLRCFAFPFLLSQCKYQQRVLCILTWVALPIALHHGLIM